MNNTINLLNNEITRNQAYHDHKETMAWVATAFYISGMFILGWQLDINNCWQKVIAIVVAVIITSFAYWFVIWLFNNRRIAASRVKELIIIAKKLCEKDDCDELKRYFQSIEAHKSDPDTTMVISLISMGVAFTVFILLVCF